MAGYVCPRCNRKTKLPDFCCGSSMAPEGSYVCPSCYKKSEKATTCDCGTEMIQL